MKNLSLIIVSLFLFGNCNLAAQDEFAQIADETCECMEKHIPKGDFSRLQAMTIVELCVIKSSENHSQFVSYTLGKKMTEKEDVENVLVYIGNQLFENCDIVKEVQKTLDAKSGESETSDMPIETLAGYTGVVVAVEGEDFLRMKIRISEEVQVFYFIGNFAGRDIAKQGNSLIGKSVYIEYSNTEVYSPKTNSFIGVKEISRIALQ